MLEGIEMVRETEMVRVRVRKTELVRELKGDGASSEERWRYRDKHCPLRHLTTQAKFRLSFADYLSPSVRHCK